MRLNDRAKSLMSFYLPVVDFRVLLGSSGKKYTEVLLHTNCRRGTLVYLLSCKDQSICFLW